MEKLKEKFHSIQFKLFFVLCIAIIFLVICLIGINSLVLKSFYLHSKTKDIQAVYHKINQYYQAPNLEINLEAELKKIAFRNNFDILIKSDTDLIIFTTDRDFLSSLTRATDISQLEARNGAKKDLITKNENYQIQTVNDETNNTNYILLSGKLVNSYELYIRIPIAPIEESVTISNNVLICIGLLTIVLSSVIVSFISRKFTKPITQLNEITNKMANLDFSQKYRITDSGDEMNDLGRNINTMSDKLETTIQQLKENNLELEKDIEEKSKIDEMRKQFISDVSHELKTPIALIQGYAEGLLENVNTDEASRKFYAEVILDESNRMDKLVKQLLQLMQLEYGKREFHDKPFDMVEFIQEMLRKYQKIIEEEQIQIIFDEKEPTQVYADAFSIDQVMTNYFTNALKHVQEINGKKQIKIEIAFNSTTSKVRISVFNTGKAIAEEHFEKIWGRFYKVDSSRNREDGGSGIGLALVKAIQNHYQNSYGVQNVKDGVLFYFDINTKPCQAKKEEKKNEFDDNIWQMQVDRDSIIKVEQ